MTRGLPLALAVVLAGCATMPPAPPGQLEDRAARYQCSDGAAFTARFDPYGEAATLTFERLDPTDPDARSQDGDFRITLPAQMTGSGIWYAGGGWALRGKGDAATLTRPDGRRSECRVGAEPGAGPIMSSPDAI